jgi:hypothetical protein
MSEQHGLHRKVNIPAGDLVIHAGDFTFLSRSPLQIRDFNDWLGELQHRHIATRS